mmetsp:Transcript_5154/g.8904  ORF Transcript_5154/g.8904 Transcript_5154/m.8904 type:complete len:200 (-) Transcript_5154:147-746(-)
MIRCNVAMSCATVPITMRLNKKIPSSTKHLPVKISCHVERKPPVGLVSALVSKMKRLRALCVELACNTSSADVIVTIVSSAPTPPITTSPCTSRAFLSSISSFLSATCRRRNSTRPVRLLRDLTTHLLQREIMLAINIPINTRAKHSCATLTKRRSAVSAALTVDVPTWTTAYVTEDRIMTNAKLPMEKRSAFILDRKK